MKSASFWHEFRVYTLKDACVTFRKADGSGCKFCQPFLVDGGNRMKGNAVRQLIGLIAIYGTDSESKLLRIIEEGVVFSKNRKTNMNTDTAGLTEIIPAFF